MNSDVSDETPLKKPFWGLRQGRPLFAAIVAQVLLLAFAVTVVVVIPEPDRAPEFVASKTVYLPQKELEHQAALSEFQQAASSSADIARLMSEQLMPDDLGIPAVPELEWSAFSPLEVDSPMQSEALFGDSGLMASLQGLNAESSSLSFLGIEDRATRVVLAFDVSSSVMNNMKKEGLTLKALQSEARKLIEGLDANTLLGMVQFSRAYETFQDHLVPATVDNKALAIHWLENELKKGGGRGWARGSPDGIQTVLEACFALQPEVVFLLSDASFERTKEAGRGYESVPWDELGDDIRRYQKDLVEDARIHFIGFEVKEAKGKEMRQLIGRHGGVYREYRAP